MKQLREPVDASTAGLEGHAGFEECVAPHVARMTRFAYRIAGPADAEDVVQESLHAAWSLSDRFDPARGSAEGWLLALVADHANRLLRKKKRRTATLRRIETRNSYVDSYPDLDLARVVGMLSERQRIAVELFYFLDLPVAEVAEVMRCSEGTVKSTLHDARQRIASKLEEAQDD